MVYRALIDEPEFGKQVFQYLEAINNIATPDEAEAILGNIDDLDFKMRAYVNESGKKQVLMDVESVPELTLPAGTPISKLDSLLGIATICLDGGLHIDMVHELLDAAATEAGWRGSASHHCACGSPRASRTTRSSKSGTGS